MECKAITEKCAKCDKPAMGHCTDCEIPLCEDHAKYAFSIKADPSRIKCHNCNKNHRKKIIISATVLSIIIVSGIAFLLFYLGSLIPL